MANAKETEYLYPALLNANIYHVFSIEGNIIYYRGTNLYWNSVLPINDEISWTLMAISFARDKSGDSGNFTFL